jgi:sialate O-acetylesterase
MKKTILCHVSPVAFVLALLSPQLRADVALNGLFTDNMVLQSGQPVPVWGTADAGETVTVTFAGQKKTADPRNGRWQVALDPLPASNDGQTLTITGHNTITLQNVVVGEVWLASGQSNMGFPLNAASNAATEIPQATDPLLRFYSVAHMCSADVQTNVKGKWETSTPDGAKNFSAVAYFFGKALRAKLNEPVGLINSSWGGTPAQAWTSMDALRQDPPFPKFIDQWNKALTDHQNVLAHPELETAYQDTLKKWQAEVAPSFNDAMKAWNAAVAANGAAAAGPKPTPSQPEPKNPDPTGMPNPSARPSVPGVIFNGMIAPLIPFSVKGVIWYQGEANGGQGFEYRTLFPRMITDWRTRWAQASFPFLYVQLPGWSANDKRPPDQHGWPWLREAQLMTLSLPETGMVVAADIGDPNNVHPKDKIDVGNRLALLARKIAYKENIQAFGPLYDRFTVEGDKVKIHFKESGAGLVIGQSPWRPPGIAPWPTDKLLGFVIAGADKHWVDAQAQIVGPDTIEVSSTQVSNPVAVRYGWANSPDVNLYNKDGLPASPFRTDDWTIAQLDQPSAKTE